LFLLFSKIFSPSEGGLETGRLQSYEIVGIALEIGAKLFICKSSMPLQ